MLLNRFGIIATHDDAGFGFYDCGRGDCLICRADGACKHADEGYSNRARECDDDDLEMCRSVRAEK